MQKGPLAGILRPLAAYGASVLLAVLITWPAALDMTGSFLGHPGNDTWNHAWGMWWIQSGMFESGEVPLRTHLVNHPHGGTLFYIDTFNAVISAPLRLLFDIPVTFNLLVILSLAWNAFGAWALGRHVLRDDWIAAVPAAVYGTSAHIIGQTYNGITESVNTGWLPIYALALLMTLERPRPLRGLAMGLSLAVCALTNFYYGLFGILLSLVIVIHQAIRAPRQVRWAPFVGFTILGATLFSTLVLPVLMRLSSSMSASDAIVKRDPEFVWASLINHNMTDVVSLLRPGDHFSPDLKALYGEDLVIVIYLGWVALALAGWALARHRPRREMSLWIWVSAIFLVFSLGPYLHVNGEYVLLRGQRVPLPFLAFFDAFPLFSRISHPFRFVVPATLGLGMLAGFGVRALTRSLSQPSWALSSLAAAAVTAEILLASPAPWPLPRCEAAIPEVYAEAIQEEGAVLDLPITLPNLERAVFLWYQTAHARPGPYGLNDPLPDALERNPLTWMLIQLEASRALDLPDTLPELELTMGAHMLALEGYRYIVVHERLYPEHKRQMVSSLLSALFGEPMRTEGVAVYEVGS
ncbi:MAG: hypothetical protein H6741_01095 [Alphaproteobacteria bacterium]|nr:hypothetical protein [Alphaproteobacteria bacterium]MCB9791295.1 hypothetical protein [Alphaproteobacteria bacterium]